MNKNDLIASYEEASSKIYSVKNREDGFNNLINKIVMAYPTSYFVDADYENTLQELVTLSKARKPKEEDKDGETVADMSLD